VGRNLNKAFWIKFSVIFAYACLHFFLASGGVFLRLSNICFNVGFASLALALILELLNRNYFKLFMYPVYFIRQSRLISDQRKRNLATEKMLSPFEYETKDVKKRPNKSFYLLALWFIPLSLLFAFLVR